MRTSRVSQETSKYFSTSSMQVSSSSTSSTSTPLRRSTRASLSRFAYSNDGLAGAAASKVQEKENTPASLLTFGSDIEDAVLSSPRTRSRTRTPTTTARALKRKRTTTATTLPLSPSTTTKTEVEQEELEQKADPPAFPSPPAKPKPKARARKPARVKLDPDTGETTVTPPSDWEQMYEVVKHMRFSPGGAASNAAVDTMGCERLARASSTARERRFHTLVALMLSSQTKDTVNAAAMHRLHTELPGSPAPGLTLQNVLDADPALLNELIGKVGFHNNKTRYIKQAAEILRDRFGGDIPPTIEGLTSLPGVGPKMAYLCMSAPDGWDRVEGIGVDVHVHRITNLWGWNTTRNPEETRAALQAWLPRDRWREINSLLVGLGQTVCLPVGRRCGDCELGLQGLCKAAERKKVIEGRKRRDQSMQMYGDGSVVKKEEVLEEKVIKEEAVDEELVKSEDAEEAEKAVDAVKAEESSDEGAARGGKRRKQLARR